MFMHGHTVATVVYQGVATNLVPGSSPAYEANSTSFNVCFKRCSINGLDPPTYPCFKAPSYITPPKMIRTQNKDKHDLLT